jgi:hypothetical protein|nr:MAG TPA: hypothetical protein [Caudoviricetes sp.]
MVGVKVGSIPIQGARAAKAGARFERKCEHIMEITFDNQALIVMALEAHIRSLNEGREALNDTYISGVIDERIAAIAPVLDALTSGDYYLELQEV